LDTITNPGTLAHNVKRLSHLDLPGAGQVSISTSTGWASWTLMRSPRTWNQAPGKGVKALIRRNTSPTGSDQSIRVSALSILAA